MELEFEKPKLTEKQLTTLLACPICKKQPTLYLNRQIAYLGGHKREYYDCSCARCGLIGRGGKRISDAIKKWNSTVQLILDAIGRRDCVEVALNVEDGFERGAIAEGGKLAYFPQVPSKGDPINIEDDFYIVDEVGWSVYKDGTVHRPTLWLISED